MAEEKLNAADAAAGGMPQFDFSTFASQVTWLAITFGILYLILSIMILPKIGNTISNRHNRIADDLDTASRMQREAEIESEIMAADAEAAAQALKAEAKISDIRNEALSNIDGIAKDVASDIVKKFLGKAPTAAQLKKVLGG